MVSNSGCAETMAMTFDLPSDEASTVNASLSWLALRIGKA